MTDKTEFTEVETTEMTDDIIDVDTVEEQIAKEEEKHFTEYLESEPKWWNDKEDVVTLE